MRKEKKVTINDLMEKLTEIRNNVDDIVEQNTIFNTKESETQ